MTKKYSGAIVLELKAAHEESLQVLAATFNSRIIGGSFCIPAGIAILHQDHLETQVGDGVYKFRFEVLKTICVGDKIIWQEARP